MAGVILTNPSADFSSCAPLEYVPFVSSCRAWMFLGRNAEQSLKNYVPGSQGGILVGGGPAIMPSYCRFETISGVPGGYINSRAAEADQMTLLAVCRAPTFTNSTNSAHFISDENDGASGIGFKAINGGPSIRGWYDNDGTPAVRLKSYAPPDTPTRIAHVKEWAFRGGILGVANITYIDKTHAHSTSTTVSLTARIRNTGANGLFIGADAAGTTPLPSEVAWVGIYGAELTDAQIVHIYKVVKGIMGRRQIVI